MWAAAAIAGRCASRGDAETARQAASSVKAGTGMEGGGRLAGGFIRDYEKTSGPEGYHVRASGSPGISRPRPTSRLQRSSSSLTSIEAMPCSSKSPVLQPSAAGRISGSRSRLRRSQRAGVADQGQPPPKMARARGRRVEVPLMGNLSARGKRAQPIHPFSPRSTRRATGRTGAPPAQFTPRPIPPAGSGNGLDALLVLRQLGRGAAIDDLALVQQSARSATGEG